MASVGGEREKRGDVNNYVTAARTSSGWLLKASYSMAITRIINIERGRLCVLSRFKGNRGHLTC
jgi:hypothetical protein